MTKEELEITLGIKNKVVEEYFRKQLGIIVRLISDFHLPYELKLEVVENAKDDKYSSTHHFD